MTREKIEIDFLDYDDDDGELYYDTIVSEIYSSSEELAKLSPSACLAFASRCARRVLPIMRDYMNPAVFQILSCTLSGAEMLSAGGGGGGGPSLEVRRPVFYARGIFEGMYICLCVVWLL